jgi:hypothetical protein
MGQVAISNVCPHFKTLSYNLPIGTTETHKKMPMVRVIGNPAEKPTRYPQHTNEAQSS